MIGHWTKRAWCCAKKHENLAGQDRSRLEFLCLVDCLNNAKESIQPIRTGQAVLLGRLRAALHFTPLTHHEHARTSRRLGSINYTQPFYPIDLTTPSSCARAEVQDSLLAHQAWRTLAQEPIRRGPHDPCTWRQGTPRQRLCQAVLRSRESFATRIVSTRIRLFIYFLASQFSWSTGLIITEGVHINPKARGWVEVPGIWTKEQTESWKVCLACCGGLCLELSLTFSGSYRSRAQERWHHRLAAVASRTSEPLELP